MSYTIYYCCIHQLSLFLNNSFTNYNNAIKLQSEVATAKELIAKGKVSRHQLEKKLRSALLQGMTAMNMETTHVFDD
jgi:hypothetical protein